MTDTNSIMRRAIGMLALVAIGGLAAQLSHVAAAGNDVLLERIMRAQERQVRALEEIAKAISRCK